MLITLHDGSTLAARGRVDALSLPELRAALRDAVGAGEGVLVLDCAGLELVDTAGLGALLTAHHRAVRLGRSLRLVHVDPPLLRLLTVTRLARVLDVEIDLAA